MFHELDYLEEMEEFILPVAMLKSLELVPYNTLEDFIENVISIV